MNTTTSARFALTVTADIKNTGSRDGAEIVQLYANFNGDTHYGKNGNMRHKLVGFARVELKAGETKQLTAIFYWIIKVKRHAKGFF